MGKAVPENKGSPQVPSEFSIMDRKPIITYAGDKALFATLEQSLIDGIPKDSTEWKRSYGRPVISVTTEALFSPFDRKELPKEGDWHLIGLPIFHTYWTECVDVDVYKTSVRDDIDSWLKVLQRYGVEDWLIVQVETYDTKRSNKLLPRTTVLDKIRSDFASKHPDRCISVFNPIRSESKSAETWRGLLFRLRVLLLQAYDTTLVRFEETIRKQRERRIEPGWSFCKYFLLQEELAFVLEMLGLFEEALVQYDELDALFTQFVLNSTVGETPKWLGSFQGPLESWPGLHLTQKVNQEQRLLLQNSKASLLQFRSYLFSRQCAMLLLTRKPWEIAKRTLPFLLNCVAELRILEVACPPGSVACWLFLGCLEVLRSCEQFNEIFEVQKYSMFTASLWAYASDKLKELGELCGLLPGMEPTSEQLHLVVGLSAGMGDAPLLSNNRTPTDQLKEALSSNEAFKKHYLEFSELAMGTFKHIGRVRLARVIGRNLAAFHQRLGEYQKASTFLADALQMLEAEGWRAMAVETKQELVTCYLHTGDKEKYVKTCASLACCHELDHEKRTYYFNQMVEVLASISTEIPLLTNFSEAFELLNVTVKTEKQKLVVGGAVEVEVELNSLLPCSVTVQLASLSMEKIPDKEEMTNNSSNVDKKNSSERFAPSSSQATLKRSCEISRLPENPLLSRISLCQCVDYQQDQSLKAAWATCKDSRNFLRRADSQGSYRKASTTSRADFSLSVSVKNFNLVPGKNTLFLESKITESGKVQFSQMSIKICEERLEFLSCALQQGIGFEVTSESTTVSLKQSENDLLAGLEQEVTLTVNTGSHCIEKDSKLILRPTEGLQTQLKLAADEPLLSELVITLPETQPFETSEYPLRVLARLGPQTDNSVLEHKVEIDCPWSKEAEPAALHFQPPFYTCLRLHTSHRRKFAQIVVTGLTRSPLKLIEPELKLSQDRASVRLLPLNPKGGQPMVVSHGFNVVLLWELEVTEIEGEETNADPISAVFTMSYHPMQTENDSSHRLYNCSFAINDYKTLIVTSAKVEPSKGSEFCRASTMCHLHLTVERVSENLRSPLMYEVLVDQTMWAVCGRTTGVVTVDETHKQTIQLDVMPLMSGYLPVPHVRLSKYIPADQKPISKASTLQPRREPFSPGQVFNNSKALQVHVLPSVPPGDTP
ncbi:trafficking protein particle complex subunit 10 [Thrips palmi]|uniref:Trafficking protein particle complex subunit 10 n=1 Tax=Thrips palmi TaxID=161013 RepID=A0A6P9A6L4_THRPL|nr:trafficking protein particle complex subunit 10 [Thrips palmi]XP_034253553.1 trafficking protein particle complex subunit 10 [Thrips palmi]